MGDDFLGFYAVSCFIERWSKNRDSTFAWNNRNEATANSALGRQTDMPCPPTRGVIEPRHAHCRQDIRNVLGLHDALAGSRIDSVIRQRGAHPGQLYRVHAD